MVHVTRILEKSRDLTCRKNGRKSLNEKDIYFKESIPLALNNFVKGGGTKETGVACAKDLLSLVGCLQRHDMNQTMCSKEILRFNKCSERVALEKETLKANRSKTQLPVGQDAKLTGNELNLYFKKFPQSARKGPSFIPKDSH
eukprot:TRINITY_DN463_c0_g1_i1.p1 TRINITY_DN463_c0_g1~~TRINITY_DN463_c0_g1_i1.p1  ORF type:complete len:143 (+),score=37.65 TRINITY_DN463_c0_g1_i1:70-498(+)